MLISESEIISGARAVRPIGRITAVSIWRASRHTAASARAEPSSDGRMLGELIRRAEDIDADAIVAVSYTVEPLVREGGISLERICVEGIAVRVLTAA